MGLDLIDRKIKELKKISNDLDRYVIEFVKNLKDEILDMNKTQLLDNGINSKGVKISSYKPYKPYTIGQKKKKGQIYSRVTLHDTGDFFNSFYLVFFDDYFEIESSDPKAYKLKEKYGDEILGLTYDNINYLSSILKPKIIEHIKTMI